MDNINQCNNIKSSNINEYTCRMCCTSYNPPDLVSLFEEYNTIYKLYSVLMLCFPVYIGETDQLPKCICNSCKNKLIETYNLRELCIESDRKLKELLYESKSSTVFVEVKTENDLDCNDIEGQDQEELIVDDSINTTDPQLDSSEILAKCEIICSDEEVNINEDIEDSNEFPEEEYSDDEIDSDIDNEIEKGLHKKRLCAQSKKYKCEKCDEKFGAPKMLDRHKLMHSDLINNNTTIVEIPKLNEYKCYCCEINFKNLIVMYDHISESHNNTKKEHFRCEFCLRTFKRLEAVKCHIRKHREEKIRRCNYCAVVFDVDIRLLDHINRHRGFKAYACTTCNKAYNTELALKDHQRLHGDKLLLCTHCGKGFNSKSNLRTHLVLHNDEKRYSCTKCPSRFKLACEYKI